jgi:ribosomal protein L33
MSQEKLIKIQNKETKTIYFTRKNKKTVQKKLELKKYDKKLRKRVTFKEIKK